MSNGPDDWHNYLLDGEIEKTACAENFLAKIRNRCVQRMRAAYTAKRKGKIRRPYQDLPRAEARGE